MNSLAKLQKNEFVRFFFRWNAPFVMALFLLLFSTPVVAQAPDPRFQSNWFPNEYQVVCEPSEPSYVCKLNEEDHESVVSLLKKAVADIPKTDFRAPTWWAPVKTNESDGRQYVELYATGSAGIAYVSCQSYGLYNPIQQAIMNVGNKYADYRGANAEYFNYLFVSHEVFHLVQYEYPFWDSAKCGGNVPGWVMESTATAFSTHMMRQKYPSVWPSKRTKIEAATFAGLRRYDQSLPVRLFNADGEIRSGPAIYQRTSSFWRHLADTYYGGKYGFLANFMSSTAVGDNGWVSWLRKNVRSHTRVDLGLIFGGFLGDFAGWSEEGFPGGIFEREEWLQEAFDGCETIYLNSVEPVDYVDIDLQPLAGDCIEVSVTTLSVAKDDSFAVQIAGMIMSGSPASQGGLHLALAASNDKRDFLCAEEVKQSGKAGLGKCLFIPDDGKIRLGGGTVDARVWNVIAQEKGGAKEKRHRVDTQSRAGEVKNLYTISYTPTQISMRDKRHSSREPITVRLYFILDVAKVEMEGNKKGAIGHMAEGADPQTTLPKQDVSGKRVNSFSKPDQFQMPFSLPSIAPPQAQGKLSYFVVGQSAANADSPASAVELFPLRYTGSDGKTEAYPLSVGETGEFPVHVVGSLNGEPIVSLGPGSLNVLEFTDLMFRARFSANVCRHSDLAIEKGAQRDKPCRNPVPLSGDIVKAFAGSRLPGNYMVTERTEGTEIYRKANEQGMAEWFSQPAKPGGGQDTGTPVPPGSGSSSGGNLPACTCTCEERAGIQEQADDLKARRAAGEEISGGDFMGLMSCTRQCQSEYLVCAVAEGEEKKARKKAERTAQEEKLAGECDCSCDALDAMQSRSEELLNGMQAGIPIDLTELQQMGVCAGVCQQAMFSCAGSR